MTDVCLLFGGESSEYEVSLSSCAAVLDALPRDRFRLHTVAVTRTGGWRTPLLSTPPPCASPLPTCANWKSARFTTGAGCGTVSSLAIPSLQSEYPLPLYGIIEPLAAACGRASAKTGTPVLLLGTRATCEGGVFTPCLPRFGRRSAPPFPRK